ncbi:MAG: transposase [Burkholderiales bacterium]
MPRIARTIAARLPHHVTQRGNRREQVFFSDGDRRAYLRWLAEYACGNGVEVLAYCLMPNHVHLVVVPEAEESLQRTLKPLHMRYAQRINRERGWNGHLWQGRYFSSALDDDYFWAAIRYVERNPVRAGMVDRAEHYAWSSAAAHCGLRQDPTLTREARWVEMVGTVGNWSTWLADLEDEGRVDMLRRNAGKGLPCGSDGFIRRLEYLTGRDLHFRPQGGQPK